MSFSAVTVVRPYEQIVHQIQAAIREEGLEEGDRLPTERELAETFGVSRSVVREAIKVLSAQGLVESRQGSGLYVRNRPIESVSRAIVLSVSPDLGSVEKLFEFRTLLEADAAQLAAIHATPEQVAELEAIVRGYRSTSDAALNWQRFEAVDNAIHDKIAETAGNPYLSVMVASVRELMRDIVAIIADHPGSIDEAMQHHKSIVAAIAAHDSELAAREMAAHVGYTAGVVQRQAGTKGTAGETTSSTSKPS